MIVNRGVGNTTTLIQTLSLNPNTLLIVKTESDRKRLLSKLTPEYSKQITPFYGHPLKWHGLSRDKIILFDNDVQMKIFQELIEMCGPKRELIERNKWLTQSNNELSKSTIIYRNIISEQNQTSDKIKHLKNSFTARLKFLFSGKL